MKWEHSAIPKCDGNTMLREGAVVKLYYAKKRWETIQRQDAEGTLNYA